MKCGINFKLKWLVIIVILGFFNLSFAFDIINNSTFNKELEEYKKSEKEKIIKNAIKCVKSVAPLRFLRAIEGQDDPNDFFCDEYEKKLTKLPMIGKAAVMPWSGYYWPIRQGVISLRYGINNKNSMREYNEEHHTLLRAYKYEESITKYKQPQDYNSIIRNSSINLEDYINEYYSPSEKYDFLVGDYNYTLTNAMKVQGYFVRRDPDGDVAIWMGICHGWSPASYKEKRPEKTVKILASDGKTQVEFLPDDIKALVTLYWAETKYPTRFIGGKCEYENETTIPKDPDTGLWEENTCFSINPASLTIAMANQIGIRKRNLIFDPDTNGEIWNQPVYSYEMEYFNIINTSVTSDLTNAKTSVEELKIIKNVKIMKFIMRKKNPMTKFFVGVKMTVHFIYEIGPVHSEKKREDNKSSMDYSYILELDEMDNVIGGEWIQNSHPTFIWMPDENSRIHNREDDLVGTFKGTVEDYRRIRSLAIRASKNKNVLKPVVDYILNLSAAAY